MKIFQGSLFSSCWGFFKNLSKVSNVFIVVLSLMFESLAWRQVSGLQGQYIAFSVNVALASKLLKMKMVFQAIDYQSWDPGTKITRWLNGQLCP